MHMICYMSDYSNPIDNIHKDIEEITIVAKRENALRQITGVLFFFEGKFLQVVEGEEPVLRQLMKNIEADGRHENIEYLIDTEVEKRGFYDWNMDSFNFSNGRKFNRDNLRQLSENFKKTLLPRSDTLVFFYKKILEEVENPLKK